MNMLHAGDLGFVFRTNPSGPVYTEADAIRAWSFRLRDVDANSTASGDPADDAVHLRFTFDWEATHGIIDTGGTSGAPYSLLAWGNAGLKGVVGFKVHQTDSGIFILAMSKINGCEPSGRYDDVFEVRVSGGPAGAVPVMNFAPT